jgi:hypothetical protein
LLTFLLRLGNDTVDNVTNEVKSNAEQQGNLRQMQSFISFFGTIDMRFEGIDSKEQANATPVDTAQDTATTVNAQVNQAGELFLVRLS